MIPLHQLEGNQATEKEVLQVYVVHIIPAYAHYRHTVVKIHHQGLPPHHDIEPQLEEPRIRKDRPHQYI